ncbi:MAG: prefoldin subunit [Candidatus Pacearchaeota archaeon]
MVEEHNCEDGECGHDHSHNPFGDLDEETQIKIQELQLLDQQYQQILMQKNALTFDLNETDLILTEVEKTNSEVMRVLGNQVIIKSTKEEILEEMKHKKELLTKRMNNLSEQEKQFNDQVNLLKDEIMKKIHPSSE